MSDDFKREERYIVIKRTDAIKWLCPATIDKLEGYVEIITHNRLNQGRGPLECVVVESDWPEYDPVWAMIEARMTGQAAKPEQAQTAVVLPEPINRDEVLDRYAEKWPWDEVGAYMDGYNAATAKTSEAVRELVDALRMVLDDPESLDGRPRTYAAVTDVLDKYAPKKREQG